ncbi:MAG: PAS domain S-box protein [Gemmatimonadetes bacterium]|nr:PAS domain S-box protein [Gemmatimonadota bacterium]
MQYLNAAGRRLLGIAPDEPLERFNSAQFLAPSELHRQHDVRALTAGVGVLELERELQRVDGSTVQVSQVLLVHKDATGRVEFISTIARDISDQRRQEQALRQAQKMEAVGRLAGGVAHDFNNLLTVILNCGESLAQTLPASDERREEAIEIVHASQRAARLTRQLLAFSRQQVMEARTIDVNAVVRDLLVMLRRPGGRQRADRRPPQRRDAQHRRRPKPARTGPRQPRRERARCHAARRHCHHPYLGGTGRRSAHGRPRGARLGDRNG